MADPLNTNQLYKNIADKAGEVKSAYLNQPTFQSNIQASVVGGDATLNSTLNNYADKVSELFAHDKSLSTTVTGADTGIAPEGFVENPYNRAMKSADLYAQKGSEVASALKTYETRKNLLGDLVDKAVKVYEAGISGKEMDYKQAQAEFDNAYKTATLEETKRKNRADEAAKTGANATGDEKTDSMSDSQIQSEFIKKYGANAYSKIGGTQADRIAAARTLIAIVNTGGDFNAEDLMSDSQLKARDAAEQLLSKVLYAENQFTGKEGFGGTGIETGGIPSIIASKNVKELRTAIASISPEKIKELSGVAVSDKEFDRLSDLLPNKWQTEQENLRRITEMKKILQIGMEMQNKAAMENITLDKAYEKYGKPAYEKYGVEYKLGGSSSEGDWE